LEADQIWRELFHIIFRRIVLEAAKIWREPHQKNQHNNTTVPAQIWRELAQHYFSADCFGGSSDMAETTTKKLTTVLYTKYMLIKTDTTARELAPHYFPVDCFGGSSDMAETTTKKLTTVMYTKYVNNTKNYFPTEPNKLT
jgi:hypothetical protein